MSSEHINPDGSVGGFAYQAVTALGLALLDKGLTSEDLVVWRRPRKVDNSRTPPVSARPGMTAIVTAITIGPKFAVLTSRRD